MRRLIACLLSVLPIVLTANDVCAQQAFSAPSNATAESNGRPRLKQFSVPAAQARSIATTLSLRYQDVPGIRISPDARNEQLVVMAPENAHPQIAKDVRHLLERGQVQTASSVVGGPLQVNLANISWQQFEGSLHAVAGDTLPVTTSRNGQKASFQLIAAPLQGTTVEVDRANSKVTVIAPQPTLPGWQKLIAALDQMPARRGDVTELMRIENADPAPIQRMLRLLRTLENSPNAVAIPVEDNSPFRNAVFQAPNQEGGNQNAAQQDTGADQAAQGQEGDEDTGSGVIGDTQIQFVPELGQIIIRGAKRDVARVMEVIKEIELKSKLTQPEIRIAALQHTDANAVAALLTQLYEDVLSARQGDVSITSLDSPNALLLIGREEAVLSLLELIRKIDQPIEASSRLRVFRLQNASAVDAETTISDFFVDRPGSNDDPRPGLGPRVRVLADYRTNSLIVSAAPRDMAEVTRLVNELDVKEVTAKQELKVFPLANASAEDLATTLQAAITGEGEGGGDNTTLPSTSLSIVELDGNRAVDSGVLSGVVVTADTGANSIVVRAPSGSMPLIAELIRQLDKAPNIDSFVKVFTIKNGDATQLTTALQTLFGEEAGTTGTAVGGANLADLPSATAGGESSLVPLRFSTDVRTNSIVASGSSEDLEVVESILLRLDSEGFAERITEVVWLRHNDALLVAEAVTNYVNARRQSQTNIQQYQQGLGPYDLIDRDLIAIPEINSNSILLSVSPRLYEEVRRLIDRLDRRRPMVLIKVLLAEVGLSDNFEIGGEVGLQDSLAFNRGIAVPDPQIPGTGAPANPGFNFNDAGVPNANRFGQESLAAAGVTTFGVGTTNANLGYGGFVLNAASESVSLLLRTLQEANRLQILSRPQIMTMDNTQSLIRVGRIISRPNGVVLNGVGQSQVSTQDVDVGLILQVRPRVGSDGLITMEIDATKSDKDDASGTFIPDGAGGVVFIPDILDTTAQSTLTAYSGQTVIFGGLIQKRRAQISSRVPIVADIPLIGHFFKYDRDFEERTELLIIMTPILVNGDEDLEYIKKVESSRMSWCLADVVEAHGDEGLSGGYGLWGPAIGPTIYPDLNPTVQNEVIISDEPIGGPTNTDPSGDQRSPIVSEVMTDPLPLSTPPAVDPPLQSPLLPSGAAVPGGSGASSIPAAPNEVSGFQLPAAATSPAVASVGVEIPAAARTEGRLNEMPRIRQSLYPVPQNAVQENALPVSWLQMPESQQTSGVSNQYTLPKRLGNATSPGTPAADARAIGINSAVDRTPSISPRSWIK